MVGFPPISHPNGWSFLVGKPIVVGYHHFRKPLYIIYYISYIQKHVWDFCVCFCCWCCCCSYWWWWRILPNSQSKYCITLVQSYFAEVTPTNVPSPNFDNISQHDDTLWSWKSIHSRGFSTSLLVKTLNVVSIWSWATSQHAAPSVAAQHSRSSARGFGALRGGTAGNNSYTAPIDLEAKTRVIFWERLTVSCMLYVYVV